MPPILPAWMNREEPHAFGSTGGTGQVGDFAELPKAAQPGHRRAVPRWADRLVPAVTGWRR
jgi:hypothetical protein